MIPRCYYSYEDFPCMRQVPPKKQPMQQMPMNMGMPRDLNMPMDMNIGLPMEGQGGQTSGMPGGQTGQMPGQMGQIPGQMGQTGQVPGQEPGGQFPENFVEAPGSPTVLGPEYTQGYLRTIIGRKVRVVFLIGTNTIQDRVGTLTDVGISYIILREEETNLDVLCDIYSIKFVNIYPRQ